MSVTMLTRPSRPTDAFKNVPNPCTNNPSNQVYFPHPMDNSKFIQCDRYGRMYIIQVSWDLLILYKFYNLAMQFCVLV